jgi:uncharacterized protein
LVWPRRNKEVYQKLDQTMICKSAEEDGYLSKKMRKWGILLFASVSLFLGIQSCATYYQTNFAFNQEFENGNLPKALNSLRSQSAEANGKRQFLYFVNNGLILSMLGKYQESNEYFEKAYLFGEDYRINYLNEATSYLTNPMVTSYKGEDHEHLLLLYYKAINYLKQGKTEEALVECRRLNIRLQQLSDRYNSNLKYKSDAFVNLLMGIIYEKNKEYNDAFIAYRNAYEIYRNDYRTLFQLQVPQQLKTDILRTASLSGLGEELAHFKSEFNEEGYVYNPDEATLVFFWHNGLSPVKTEWGVSFVISRQGNRLLFTNNELNFAFPFSLDGYDEKDKNALANMRIFRVVFPKYVERPTYYNSAVLETNSQIIKVELIEDVNKIAFKALEERMTLEFSKALIRVAVKKSGEYQVRKKDRALGSVLGLINAATEKADTRNWQTLPNSIYYARVPLKEGQNTVKLKLTDHKGRDSEHSFTYQAQRQQILFHTFSSLESSAPNYGYY